ncbi:hypothetical protein [Methyloversatilis sp. XJ19-49]|uniref:hypothetical protein n=1 Tax=Methyloversatilis sp. XJ19-49 TaxID=2963429 RepID=UPI00211B8866|nr:hypothetical protein [Methyloversatilis sp. XJ19-49]MCQ9377694.1 hypothetical protein [Methyloversatilis sp. XJ19-49]
MTGRKPAPLLSRGVVLALAAAALFFGVWYTRYLGVDFNELGRHYDADAQVVTTDSSFVLGLPAIGCLLVALVLIGHRLWRRRG